MKEYALYKGEECLAIGTIQEISEQLGITYKSVMFYKTETYRKRLANRKSRNARELVEIEEDE